MFLIDDVLVGLAAKFLLPLAGDAVASLFGDADKPAAKEVTQQIAGAALDAAAKLSGVTITDEHSARNAVQALNLNPEALTQFQKIVSDQAVSSMAEETKRLQIVNDTIRNEANSQDPFVRRMRPTFGYAMAATWLAQMMAASYTIVTDPAKASSVMEGIASTTMLWGIGLAVLGVYFDAKSREAGVPGLLSRLPLPGKR